MIKTLPIEALSPGMMITRVIEQNGPVKIRKIGVVRSFDMVKGLKEMGVKTVEVDFSQSIEIESQDQKLESDSERQSAIQQINVKPSATKKLISSKNLQSPSEKESYQQHRSLFVPSMEETKLKWSIYSNPQITLCCLVVIGALIGWGGSFAYFEYASHRDVVANQQTYEAEQPNSEMPSSSDINENIQPINPDNLSSGQTATINTNSVSNSSNKASVSNDPRVAVNDLSDQSSIDTMQVDVENQTNASENSESGISLEDGQLVLGYRPDQSEDETGLDTIVPQADLQSSTSQTVTSQNDAAVNEDLLRRIKDAAQEVDNRFPNEFDNVLNVTDLTALPRIDQLPQNLLSQMPSMSFSAHMYASNPQDRWVRVNSRRVGEGEFITNNLILKKIEAEQVILDFRGTAFTMNALSDW